MTIETTIARGRFAALLQGAKDGRETYDRPLLESEDWVAAPTLGAVVANWLIIVPRAAALSFRDWRKRGNREPVAVIRSICDHFGLHADEVLWFEHGPARLGSVVGCGADYAHLHLLIRPTFTFESVFAEAVSMSKLTWKLTEARLSYAELPSAVSYLMAGSGCQAAWTSHVEGTGSQFFRRVISVLSNQPDHWDYRLYAHLDNVERTIETCINLESTSRRGR